MYERLQYLLYFTAITISASPPKPPNLTNKYLQAKLIPELLSTAPAKLCNVFYKRGRVKIGESIDDEDLREKPNVTWEHDGKSLHTLYMAGLTNWTIFDDQCAIKSNKPLGASWPSGLHWHQWVVINIPGGDTNQGETLFDYHEIYNPPMKDVVDRYCILIYQQPDRIIPPPPQHNNSYNFQEFCPLSKFVQDFNLGVPIAGNFFLTQIDKQSLAEIDAIPTPKVEKPREFYDYN